MQHLQMSKSSRPSNRPLSHRLLPRRPRRSLSRSRSKRPTPGPRLPMTASTRPPPIDRASAAVVVETTDPAAMESVAEVAAVVTVDVVRPEAVAAEVAVVAAEIAQ